MAKTSHTLFDVHSLTDSLTVYVPAIILQRALNLARVFLFLWLMNEAQFGLLGLATMVFSLAGTLVTLGSFNGIARYISQYEARGQLGEFFRVVARQVSLLAAAITAVLLALSPWLASWVIGTSVHSPISPEERWAVFAAALANGLLTALYLNLTAWMRGLRLYRLLSLTDVAYAVLFFALGALVLAIRPSAMMALAAHAVALALVLAVGMWAVGHALVRRAVEAAGAGELPAVTAPSAVETTGDWAIPVAAAEPPASAAIVPTPPRLAMLRRVLRFSLPALGAALAAMLLGYVSLWFVQREGGERQAGIFQAYSQLCQPIAILAATIWGVLLPYAAVHWERQERELAHLQLETAFKTTAGGLLTLAVLLNVSSRWWLVVLPAHYRQAAALLPWLLVHVLAVSNLGYVYVASQLRERPAVLVYITLAGVVVNALLAWQWVPSAGALGGAQAAAAGGAACIIAAVCYLRATGFGASGAAMVLSLLGGVLLLPPTAQLLLLLAGWILALISPAVVTPPQRELLANAARSLWTRLKGRA
jgi:O-antigen/teichoic acid export membrane protein